MKTLYYLVKLKDLISISEKAYKAIAFDSSEAIIPKSQVFKEEIDLNSNVVSYWISAWILEQKELQYSKKNKAWYNKDTGKLKRAVFIKNHIPKKVDKKTEVDESLKR